MLQEQTDRNLQALLLHASDQRDLDTSRTISAEYPEERDIRLAEEATAEHHRQSRISRENIQRRQVKRVPKIMNTIILLSFPTGSNCRNSPSNSTGVAGSGGPGVSPELPFQLPAFHFLREL